MTTTRTFHNTNMYTAVEDFCAKDPNLRDVIRLRDLTCVVIHGDCYVFEFKGMATEHVFLVHEQVVNKHTFVTVTLCE